MDRNISPEKQEFLDLIRWAQATDIGLFLAVSALLFSGLEAPTTPTFLMYTAEDYHKALAALERVKADNPQCTDSLTAAATYIHREWLHDEVTDHE